MSRPARDFRTASPKAYKSFVKSNPDVRISKEDYMAVVRAYGICAYRSVLETGKPHKLPFGLGKILYSKRMTPTYRVNFKTGLMVNNRPVDWNKTLQLWDKDPEAKKNKKLIRHMNFHTGGWRFRWRWSKSQLRIPYKNLWRMIICRKASREAAAYLKKDPIYQDLYPQETSSLKPNVKKQ